MTNNITSLFNDCLLKRQRHEKRRSLARFGFKPDLPMMQFDQCLDDRQAQTGASYVHYQSVFLVAPETFPDTIFEFFRNTDAGVFDGNQDMPVIFSPCFNIYTTTGIGVIKSIVHDVGEDLHDLVGVTLDLRQVRRDFERDFELLGCVFGAALQVGDDVFQNAAYINRLDHQFVAAGVDLRDIEQVIDQDAEPVSIGFDLGDKFLLLVRKS